MKPKAIQIKRIELRLRGTGAGPAQLAQQIVRQIGQHGGGPVPGPLVAALGDRLAAPLANLRRK